MAATRSISMEYDPACGHRWNCDNCLDFGPWMPVEADAVRAGQLHRCVDARPEG